MAHGEAADQHHSRAIVFLAIAVAVLVRGTGALMTQAGGTAVLIATLTPTVPDLEWPRTINALVGGAAGLPPMLVLLPTNPLRTVRRAAEPALDLFAREMTASAQALAQRPATGHRRAPRRGTPAGAGGCRRLTAAATRRRSGPVRGR
ncbi:aromatic acid exporter family protein [Micromonospora chokoriensis]|uniref:hypothetical protein n=1 Tax=Micromonospora chokoriensis TaxID=356851 RepID=UPI001E496C5D|nr:hypothetical protein [Micromonospora chokoriensis]